MNKSNLNRLSVVLLSLVLMLISSCSSQQKVSNIEEKTIPLQIELKLNPQWQLSYFDEPIFSSKVVVLEAGNKLKPAIVLIHGLGTLAMKDWFSIIPELEENYHVIAIDLPGFGYSPEAQGRFLPTNYAHVVATVLKNVTREKVIVMGHSMGGAVALRYTELYEESVSSLVLVDVAGLLEKSVFLKHISSIEYGDEVSFPMRLLIEGTNSLSSSLINGSSKSSWIRDFLQSNDYAWNWLVSDSSNMNAALSLVEEDFNEAVNRINVPVNIIWGENDGIAPLRTGKVLNNKIKVSRLQIISDAEHVPMKSNHVEFMDALNIALTKPISDEFSFPTAGKKQKLLTCKKENNKTYSGYYDKIIIESCTDINLKNISTSSLRIKSSVVDIENFSYTHPKNKIELIGSVVSITNANLSGNNLMWLSGSRLDMAGVAFNVTGEAVIVANGSRISASFCEVDSPKFSGILHGAFYRTYQPLIAEPVK